MKFDTNTPCGSCPYRKDSKLGLWHPEEFDNLMATEKSHMGSVFGCHATIKNDPPSVCAGWLIKQRDNGIPSIVLRLKLMRDPAARECLKRINDGGHELYETVEEMVEANESLGRCECGRYLMEDGTCSCGFFNV